MEITIDETNELIREKVQEMQDVYGKKAKLLLLEILMLKDSMKDGTRYIPLPDWNTYHPYPTVSAIRNYINNADKNGFNTVIFRRGKRIFIDEHKLFEWLMSEKDN